MNAPRGDDLERRLTELFEKRAATVKQAPRVDLGSDKSNRKAAGPQPARSGRLRENLGLIAAAAVVFVAIAGTVLGIQAGLSGRGQTDSDGINGAGPNGSGISATNGATMPSCTAPVPAPASWLRAIEAGTVPVDRTFNVVVSVNSGTGDYLALQGNDPPGQTPGIYYDTEVALFRGSRGVTLYTSEADDITHADPTGAITADWVTFAAARPYDSDYRGYKVMLYERDRRITRVLVELPQQDDSQGRSMLGAPVIAAGKVYWLSTVHDKPETTTLDSWDLAQNSATGSVPAAGATGLVSYGIGVALIREGASEATLTHGAGAPLSSSPKISRGLVGNNFGFDGRNKLSYVRQEDSRTVFYSLVVGSDSLVSTGYPVDGPFAKAAIFPFLAVEPPAPYGLLDLRSGGNIRLPAGVSLQGVVGDEVIFGTGTTESGAAGFSLVRLSALPPARC
jgi:hypothetical protein